MLSRMADARKHPLFRQFPLSGKAQLATGERVPTPYHVYAGHGLFIGGTADLGAVNALLQGEQVQAVVTEAGRALAAVWVCDFTDASLGPHHELQVALAVAFGPTEPLSDEPFSLLKAISEGAAVRLLCHGLWNNSETAVAYNRELLGLPARLSRGEVTREAGRKSFTFYDAASGALLARGSVREAPRVGLATTWKIFRGIGFRQMARLTQDPVLSSFVVNPISDAMPYNAEAVAFLAPETAVVQLYDSAEDHLALPQAPYRSLGFTPLFLEHMQPFRFVYLMPQPRQSAT